MLSEQHLYDNIKFLYAANGLSISGVIWNLLAGESFLPAHRLIDLGFRRTLN